MNSESLHQSPEITMPPAEAFKYRSLALLSDQLRQYTPEGYPSPGDRFTLAKAVNPATDLANPSWEAGDQQLTTEDQGKIATLGCRLDRAGRPLHPWYDEMTADSSVGVASGKGCFYEWGPNFTADSVIIQGSYVLLIFRGDTRTWASVGGFVDKDDSGQYEPYLNAAIREPKEEADIDLQDWPEPSLLHEGPVADPRITAHAWIETRAYCFFRDGGQPLPDIKGGDDAEMARWFPLELARSMQLYGSHSLFIELACRQLGLDHVSETASPYSV